MTLDQEMKETNMASRLEMEVSQAEIIVGYGMDNESSALCIGTVAVVSHAVADETNTDSKADEPDPIFAAKNRLARRPFTAVSARNRAPGAVKESDLTAADEMESYYEDDGHSPRNVKEQVDMAYVPCSRDEWAAARDEWAAARDDIDFIINDTAKSVGIARLRAANKGHNTIVDHDKSLNERQDAIATMGSTRSVLDKETFGGGTIEETRLPGGKGASSFKPKMWEKLRTITERPRAVGSGR